MKGLLLLSHGDLAEGLKHTASFFFGDDIPQFETECFQMMDSIDDFSKRIGEKIKMIDDGDGVVVLCDLYGGTPTHQVTPYLGENVEVIAGMNLAMVMEILSSRQFGDDLSANKIKEVGKGAIEKWNPLEIEDKNSNEVFFDEL